MRSTTTRARTRVPSQARQAAAKQSVSPVLKPENPAEGYLTAEQWVSVGSAFGLTTCELEVAVLLFHGKTRTSIARQLKRSAGAVRERIDALFRKLQVRHVLGLAVRIARAKDELAMKDQPPA